MYIVIDKRNNKTAICKTRTCIAEFLNLEYISIWKRFKENNLKSKKFEIIKPDFVCLKGKNRGANL